MMSMTSPKTANATIKLETLPIEMLQNVLLFLTNDGNSIMKLKLCSKTMYDRLTNNTSLDDSLWKQLNQQRWKNHSQKYLYDILSTNSNSINSHKVNDIDTTSSPNFLSEHNESITRFCQLYIARRKIDSVCIQQLEQMTCNLQAALNVDDSNYRYDDDDDNDDTVEQQSRPQEYPSIDGNLHIGQAWGHSSYNTILQFGMDAYDILCSVGNEQLQKLSQRPKKVSIHDRLLGFLATRSVQNIHFANCLKQWKCLLEKERIMLQNTIQQLLEQDQQQAAQFNNIHFLEQYLLLLCKAQQTPINIISPQKENIVSFYGSIHQTTAILDDIAMECQSRIIQQQQRQVGLIQTVTKLQIIHDCLRNTYGLSGNETDYYNHRNSLLDHVLRTKKGIPLSLCIVYCCICRRIGISSVNIVGLPGHVVLGFHNENNDNDENTTTNCNNSSISFMDVFNDGRILSILDCQDIVASYRVPWQDNFLLPLSNKMIIHRVLNNLSNSHLQAMSSNTPYHSDLYFQQRALGTIHRQSHDIAIPMIDRVVQELPLTLSIDLLKQYNLLTES